MSANEPSRILTENGQQQSPRNRPMDDDGSSEDGSKQNNDETENSTTATSLVTAINRKYFSEQCNALPMEAAIFMNTIDHLPGKRRASGSLELLVLNEHQISIAGDLCQLSPMVRNITELDLAFNQLSNWKEVFTMLTQMPHLVHANLSHNPLNGSLSKEDDWLTSFLTNIDGGVMSKMSSLVLNATGIHWESLFTFLDIMPNLEELHLSLNDYSNLDIGEDEEDGGRMLESSTMTTIAPTTRSFPHIHNLHVNHCQLKSWRSLLAICRMFPCLETLVAAGNAISMIGGGTDDDEKVKKMIEAEMNEHFGCLHTLNANYWPLTDWSHVDRIRKFPLLSELRINHVPLLQPFSDVDRRHLLIARLPDVTSLNGSAVTAEQRENAERFFLRFYLEQEAKPKRYFELESVHGRLMPLVEIDLSPKDCADVIFIMDDRKERARISLNQSVAELKKSLQSFCHMPPGRFRLFIQHAVDIDRDMRCIDELRFPKIMLHSLSVEDNDEFHIQAKPEPPTRRRTSSSTSASAPSTTSPSKTSSSSNSSCTNCSSMEAASPVKR